MPVVTLCPPHGRSLAHSLSPSTSPPRLTTPTCSSRPTAIAGAGGGFCDDDDEAGAPGGADFGGWGDLDFGEEGAGGGYSRAEGGGDGSVLGGEGELLSAPRGVERVEVNYSKAAKQASGALSLCDRRMVLSLLHRAGWR